MSNVKHFKASVLESQKYGFIFSMSKVKMSRQSELLLALSVVFITLHLISAQSISTVDKELHQVSNSLFNTVSRIRSALDDLKQKLNKAIDSSKPTTALSDLVAELKKMRDLTTKLMTIKNDEQYHHILSCDDVVSKIQTIKLDINTCVQLNLEIAQNTISLLVQYNIVCSTFVSNYYLMTEIQRLTVQSALTAFTIVNNYYNHYISTLVLSISEYNLINVELLNLKKNLCSCPTQLKSSSASTFASLDKTLSEIEGSVEKSEFRIRKITTDAYNIATSFGPTLNTIKTLLNEYRKLSTTDAVKATLTCDDALIKSAFVKYKSQKYYLTQLEASTNATLIFVDYYNLNELFTTNFMSLKDVQKRYFKNEIATLLNLIDAFQEYILTLITAQIKLLQLQSVADKAQSDSCRCTERSGKSLTIAQTSMVTVSTSARIFESSEKPFTTTDHEILADFAL